MENKEIESFLDKLGTENKLTGEEKQVVLPALLNAAARTIDRLKRFINSEEWKTWIDIPPALKSEIAGPFREGILFYPGLFSPSILKSTRLLVSVLINIYFRYLVFSYN